MLVKIGGEFERFAAMVAEEQPFVGMNVPPVSVHRRLPLESFPAGVALKRTLVVVHYHVFAQFFVSGEHLVALFTLHLLLHVMNTVVLVQGGPVRVTLVAVFAFERRRTRDYDVERLSGMNKYFMRRERLLRLVKSETKIAFNGSIISIGRTFTAFLHLVDFFDIRRTTPTTFFVVVGR